MASQIAPAPSSPIELPYMDNSVIEPVARAGANAFAPSGPSPFPLKSSCKQEQASSRLSASAKALCQVQGYPSHSNVTGYSCSSGHRDMGTWDRDMGTWAGAHTDVSEPLTRKASAKSLAPSAPSLLWPKSSCAQEQHKKQHDKKHAQKTWHATQTAWVCVAA